MKKFITLALTLAMLFCMATTASAATTTASVVGSVTTDNVIDPSGQPHVDPATDANEGLANGVESFSPAGTAYEVQINVSANQTKDRYAVDIEYDDSPIVIAGSTMVWDVNTMTYKTTGAGGGSAELTKEITVYNYSNKGINAAVAVTKNSTYSDAPVTITSNVANLPLDAATAGTNGDPGTAASGDIIITLDPTTTWDDVSTYLAAKGVGNAAQVTLATATLTITQA